MSWEDHQWHKANLVTVMKGSRMFDIYKCDGCGAMGRRYGLSSTITRDKKFAGPEWESCQTANAAAFRKATGQK